MWKYVYSESIFNTLYIEIKHKSLKTLDKINSTKMPLFSFASSNTVLLLICDSYMSWSKRLVSLKLCVGFSIFDSFSFLLKFLVLFHRMQGLFDFKTSIPFKFKIMEKPHTVFLPDLWLLSSNKKFNDIFWVRASKNRPGDRFFKPRKQKFWER